MEFQSRREFFQDIGKVVGGAALAGSALPPATAAEATPDLAVVKGADAKAIVKRAVEMLGGMKRFVSKGDVVVVKPNIGWDRLPHQAANTNPDIVAALVEMALNAGAKKVKVFDNPVDSARASYERSGILTAAKQAGADVIFLDKRFLVDLKIGGTFLTGTWPVYRDAFECDCYINVPIAKHHSASGLTMTFKNNMGVIEGERSQWHRSLHLALPEFAATPEIKKVSKLSILDAYRVLLRYGPNGGSRADVGNPQTVVAGIDMVAIDTYGTKFFPKADPKKLPHLLQATKMGLGQMDLSKVTIKEEELKA
jgi:uncharacterized protein (DUF362 family)